ncbi:hypothetical protein GGR42_002120 [Saonia flava]|uniref:Uncharacterized protein n=1 Tax=Saonia flava TaxID=523696 RepID=A0A846QUE3_9FLAO|nr:hypothetical protein [Saonia flava]
MNGIFNLPTQQPVCYVLIINKLGLHVFVVILLHLNSAHMLILIILTPLILKISPFAHLFEQLIYNKAIFDYIP